MNETDYPIHSERYLSFRAKQKWSSKRIEAFSSERIRQDIEQLKCQVLTKRLNEMGAAFKGRRLLGKVAMMDIYYLHGRQTMLKCYNQTMGWWILEEWHFDWRRHVRRQHVRRQHVFIWHFHNAWVKEDLKAQMELKGIGCDYCRVGTVLTF